MKTNGHMRSVEGGLYRGQHLRAANVDRIAGIAEMRSADDLGDTGVRGCSSEGETLFKRRGTVVKAGKKM